MILQPGAPHAAPGCLALKASSPGKSWGQTNKPPALQALSRFGVKPLMGDPGKAVPPQADTEQGTSPSLLLPAHPPDSFQLWHLKLSQLTPAKGTWPGFTSFVSFAS